MKGSQEQERSNTLSDYKGKIDANPIISMEDDWSSSDYKIYRNQLMEDVYCYLDIRGRSRMVNGKPSDTEFSDKIIETILECLKRYDHKKNPSFLGYFLYCWEKCYDSNVRDTIIKDQYMEMKFSEADKRLMKSFDQEYFKLPLKVDEKVKVFAEDKGISIEKAEDIYRICCNKIVRDSGGDDEEETGVLDSIASYERDPYEMAERFDLEDTFSRFLTIVEVKYSAMRVDKNIGSAVITNLTADYMLYYYHTLTSFDRIVSRYTLFNATVFAQIIEKNAPIGWDTIAKIYGKLPAAVSRAKINVEKSVFTEDVKIYLIGISSDML